MEAIRDALGALDVVGLPASERGALLTAAGVRPLTGSARCR
jgi:hypothetical protein